MGGLCCARRENKDDFWRTGSKVISTFSSYYLVIILTTRDCSSRMKSSELLSICLRFVFSYLNEVLQDQNVFDFESYMQMMGLVKVYVWPSWLWWRTRSPSLRDSTFWRRSSRARSRTAAQSPKNMHAPPTNSAATKLSCKRNFTVRCILRSVSQTIQSFSPQTKPMNRENNFWTC